MREHLLHIGKQRWTSFMKKHNLLTKMKRFNKDKFPLPDLDYSGEKLYLVGWHLTPPVRTQTLATSEGRCA